MDKVFLTSCIGLDYDLCLLEHFINHYLDMGIRHQNFLLVLNTFKDQDNKIKESEEILLKYGIKPVDIWRGEYESEEKWARINAVLTKRVTKNDWVVHPDADEFQVYPKNLNTLITDFESLGINATQGFLIDRISADLTVKDVDRDITNKIWHQYPVNANLAPLIGLKGVKLMIYRGNMRANNGSGEINDSCKHFVNYPYGSTGLQNFEITKRIMNIDNKDEFMKFDDNSMNELRSFHNFFTYHFKWNGDVMPKLEQRIETYKRLNRPQLFQSVKFIEHYKKYGKILV